MKHPPQRDGGRSGLALVREVSASYVRCRLQFRTRTPIDLELARIQHLTYVAALEWLGLKVAVLPPDDRFPDGCFVEDTAVILDEIAVITCMGADTRWGEEAAIADCLAQCKELIRMEPPARLDGGDVLRTGRQLFVGESCRTNRQGIDFLQTVAAPRGYRVTPIPVRGVLHLKTGMAALGEGTVLVAPALLPQVEPYLPPSAVIEVPESCADAANVLAFQDRVLIPQGYPPAADLLSQLGLSVREVPLTEFIKGEGGLSCLSLILSPP